MAKKPTPTFRLVRRDRPVPNRVTKSQLAGLPVEGETVRVARNVRDIWITQPLGDRWVAEFRLVQSGGRLRVGEARIFPAEGTRGYGEWSGCWRGLDAEAPRRGLTKEVLARAQPHLWLQMVEEIGFGDVFAEAFGTSRRPRRTRVDKRGRPPLPDEFLAGIARDYANALAAGHAPVKTVAEAREEPVEKIRGWVHAARGRGLLTPSAQGKTEGRLTARAQFMLAKRRKK